MPRPRRGEDFGFLYSFGVNEGFIQYTPVEIKKIVFEKRGRGVIAPPKAEYHLFVAANLRRRLKPKLPEGRVGESARLSLWLTIG